MSETRRMAGTERLWECVHCGGWHCDPVAITHTRDCAEITRLRSELDQARHSLATQAVAIDLLQKQLELKKRGTDGFGSTDKVREGGR